MTTNVLPGRVVRAGYLLLLAAIAVFAGMLILIDFHP
jgi:hypothetical protein